MKKIIAARYFDELKNAGHTVPRDTRTGDVQTNFQVGSEYTVVNKETKEEIKARCTQSYPHHLKLIQ